MTPTADGGPIGLIPEMDAPLSRLLSLRESLRAEASAAPSPAVARALQQADDYLFLALTYLGFTEKMFPQER
ncbi:MAG: hypothetical protein NVSMB4_00760 [Acidimicrobiales bacterium]